MQIAHKIQTLPPYLFSSIHQKKQALLAEGVDVIDLGIGAPDLPTPSFIIDALIEAARQPHNHKYSPFEGSKELRQAVASFYQRHYGVPLDADREVLVLIGSKEGIVNLIQTVCNPGDQVLVPNPGYPAYATAIHLADAEMVPYPLKKANHFRPDFNEIEFHHAKLMLLNYPNNPTSATVDLSVFEEAVALAKANQCILAQDAAYDLVTYDDYQSPSILQVEGAKEIAVEFGSLSKGFNMTGWRVGYVVGNAKVIEALATLKSNIDSSQFLAVQHAAAIALTSDLKEVRANNLILQERRDVVVRSLRQLGFEVLSPKASIFLWVQAPKGMDGTTFTTLLLEQQGVIVTPGAAFGTEGKSYFRIALTVPIERLQQAMERLQQVMEEL